MNNKVIYIRTSTEEQNPENQLKDCKTLISGEYEVVEEKQSAFKDKDRLKFEDIKKRIKNGEVSELICWDWDRLFRNRKKLKEFFELCKMYKCQIHSFRQSFFEDFYKIPPPFDEIIQELVLNLMGWLAEDESKKKGERVKNAVRRKEGKPTKSYKGNKWGRKSLNEKVISQILKLRQNGLSIREISKQVYYWDKNSHKKCVSIGYVSKVLKNEV